MSKMIEIQCVYCGNPVSVDPEHLDAEQAVIYKGIEDTKEKTYSVVCPHCGERNEVTVKVKE